MKFFGVSVDCGHEKGICFGDPCCVDHTQKCCMNCKIVSTCEGRCPFVNKEGKYTKGKDFKTKEEK